MRKNRRASSSCAKTRSPNGLCQLPTCLTRLEAINYNYPNRKNMSLRQSLVSSLSLVAVFAAAAVASAEETLPTPRSIILAAGQEEAARPVILAARRYAAFWNTGEPRYAEAAIAQLFDTALPDISPAPSKI